MRIAPITIMLLLSMGVWRIFPDNVVMGTDFTGLAIIPAPASVATLGLAGLAATRRSR